MTQLTASMHKSGRPTGCALNTTRDLGSWVRREMIREPPDAQHVLRVIARETDRRFRKGLAPQPITGLAAQPARTGHRRSDALIEGVVAFRLHIATMPAPAWCRQTLLDMLETPVELLDKGVTMSYRSMQSH